MDRLTQVEPELLAVTPRSVLRREKNEPGVLGLSITIGLTMIAILLVAFVLPSGISITELVRLAPMMLKSIIQFWPLWVPGLLPFAIVLVYVLIKGYEQRRLVRIGTAASGVVTSLESMHWGGRTYTKINFDYRTLRGELESGQHTVAESAAYEIQVGDKITVLFDPKQSEYSMLYKFLDYKACETAT